MIMLYLVLYKISGIFLIHYNISYLWKMRGGVGMYVRHQLHGINSVMACNTPFIIWITFVLFSS